MNYTYDKVRNNKNDRAIALFSTTAQARMRPCGSCELYTVFFRFSQFYGKTDYGNRWVRAAFSGARIAFDSSTTDFTGFSLEARSGKCRTADYDTMSHARLD
jgi:hypothetical protein